MVTTTNNPQSATGHIEPSSVAGGSDSQLFHFIKVHLFFVDGNRHRRRSQKSRTISVRDASVARVIGARIETKARIGASIRGEIDERPRRDAKLFSFQMNTE